MDGQLIAVLLSCAEKEFKTKEGNQMKFKEAIVRSQDGGSVLKFKVKNDFVLPEGLLDKVCKFTVTFEGFGADIRATPKITAIVLSTAK